MNQSNQLTSWLWKWHVIAGLITLPFVLLLSITGVIYLLKDDYNQYAYQHIHSVTPSATSKLTVDQQLQLARQSTSRQVTGLVIPTEAAQATEFMLARPGRGTDSLYVNPYSGEITGQIAQKQTLMYKIRKLHGELLLSKPGTLLIELVASWFIVLLLTGIVVWWPKSRSGVAGLFTIRTNKSPRLFWRDCHAVIGFWLSLVMLAVIAGGMPWTDVFGGQLKWVQKQTQTGYPTHWRHSKGLHSEPGDQALSTQRMIDIANSLNLPGKITLNLPTKADGVVTISNRSLWLEDQQVIHLDQYTGAVVKAHNWDDVGILMELRQIFMRFHQGEYGAVNWWAMLIIGLLFVFSTAAGLVSYLYRKQKGSWSIPRVPKRFKVTPTLQLMIVALALLFPMFGASVIAIWTWEKARKA